MNMKTWGAKRYCKILHSSNPTYTSTLERHCFLWSWWSWANVTTMLQVFQVIHSQLYYACFIMFSYISWHSTDMLCEDCSLLVCSIFLRRISTFKMEVLYLRLEGLHSPQSTINLAMFAPKGRKHCKYHAVWLPKRQSIGIYGVFLGSDGFKRSENTNCLTIFGYYKNATKKLCRQMVASWQPTKWATFWATTTSLGASPVCEALQ